MIRQSQGQDHKRRKVDEVKEKNESAKGKNTKDGNGKGVKTQAGGVHMIENKKKN